MATPIPVRADSLNATVEDNILTLAFDASGCDGLLIGLFKGLGDVPEISVQYNGVDATLVVDTGPSDNNQTDIALYRVLSPATGTHDLVVQLADVTVRWGITIAGFSGVDQTTSLGTPVTVVGTSSVLGATVVAAVGDLVVDLATFPCFSEPQAAVADAGQDEIVNNNTGTFWSPVLAMSTKVATSTSVSMGWSGNLEAADTAIIAVALKGAVSGGVSVAAGTGAIGIGTFAPSVVATQHQRVLAGVGAIGIVGKAPTITAPNPQHVRPGVGAVDIAGKAPTIAVSNQKNVLAGTGAVVVDGEVPAIVGGLTSRVPPSPLFLGQDRVPRPPRGPSLALLQSTLRPALAPQTVTAGTGRVAIGSATPTIKTSDRKNVLAGIGAVDIDGLTPTVRASDHQHILAGVGAALVDGLVPIVHATAHQWVRAGVGAIAIDGPIPTAIASGNVRVLADVGAILLRGLAPDASASGNRNVLAGIGAALIAGLPPTVHVSANQAVLAAIGAVLLEGLVPSIVGRGNQSVAAGIGAVDIDGLTPTMRASDHQHVLAGVGAVRIDGVVPIVHATANVDVHALVGAAVVAGLVPVFTAGSGIVAGVGSVLVLGRPPAIHATGNQFVRAGLGAIDIDGRIPSIDISNVQVVRPGVGAVHIDSLIPSVFASDSQRVSPLPGAVRLAAFAPVIVTAVSVQAGVGAIVWRGLVPTIRIALVVSNHVHAPAYLTLYDPQARLTLILDSEVRHVRKRFDLTEGDSGIELRAVFKHRSLASRANLAGYSARFTLADAQGGAALIPETAAQLDLTTFDPVKGTVEVFYVTGVLSAGVGLVLFALSNGTDALIHSPSPETDQISLRIKRRR